MQDRYLYRGQTRRYGEKLMNVAGDKMPSNWVYGGVFHGDGDMSIIYTLDEKYVVYTNTVCQCTGLKDKNGKLIFEGDIVKVSINGHVTVCTVNWADTVAHFQLWQINTLPKTPTHINFSNYPEEVIGNVFDNPELLEGD